MSSAYEDTLDFDEPSLRNKRTNRDRRAAVAHRTKFVPAKRLPVKGLARRNKKPSRIAGSIVSERLETTVEILKPEANPDLWLDLEEEEELAWRQARYLRRLYEYNPYESSSYGNISEMADALDLLWEEQLGRHIDARDVDESSDDGILDARMPLYAHRALHPDPGFYCYDDSSSDSDVTGNVDLWDSDSSVELRETVDSDDEDI